MSTHLVLLLPKCFPPTAFHRLTNLPRDRFLSSTRGSIQHVEKSTILVAESHDESSVDAVRRHSPSFNFSEQVTRAYTQGLGDFYDVKEADIPLAPFNPANVRPVQVCPFRETLLRKPEREPPLPYCFPKHNSWVICHASTLWFLDRL